MLTEGFDCVTLMFSDMPEFGGIVTKSSPLQLILLLNSVYSTIDLLLEAFDVYKVETINDSYMVFRKYNDNAVVYRLSFMGDRCPYLA